MPPTNARKRPAPGSSPVMQAQQMQQDYTAPAQLENEQFLRWSQAGDNTDYADPYSMNAFGANTMPSVQYQQPVQASSTQLTRRPINRQMVPAAPRATYDNPNDHWGTFGDDGMLDPQISNGMEETDNIELLEERAIIAKRDAQSKRKQIPPFVQKLSSFLDESKNTDLIRWSERGDSFVVLDEDEFAKTLIPELFKHNNYASFVRQLNMYGFHKRVGLSDNSMKASERKNKTPSEYYNPYFKRGHPNLLWLINKPKGGTGQKKSKGVQRIKTEDGGDGESDDERQDGVEETYSAGYGQNVQGGQRHISAAPESGPLQRREMVIVQNQLQEIQKQQSAISSAISRLRKDHNQLYQQAIAFQSLHDRHESSINAILTFLATVYNRSLDGQGPNIAQMFASVIPQDQQHQGNVVDMGDLNQKQQNPGSPNPQRKPQRLLMAPPSPGSPATSAQTPMSHDGHYQNSASTHGAVEELFENSAESPPIKAEIEPLPQQNIMNIIHNANAQVARPGAKVMAFPDVLSHFEHSNGNSPLTSEQRNNMLHLIAGTASPSGTNNALVSPTPPPQLNLEQMGYTQAEIEELVRMQQEQEAKLNDVNRLLRPLSPSGSIPGLSDHVSSYFPNDASHSPGGGNHLDIDQYLDAGAYYTNGDGIDFKYDGMDFGNAGDPSTFDFGIDGTGDNGGGGAVDDLGGGMVLESSSEGGSGARSTSLDIDRFDGFDDDVAVEDGGDRTPSKRRRKG